MASGYANWLDFFPVEVEPSPGFRPEKDSAMLVDIGGGIGHEVQGILKRYPSLPGRMVLQDLPNTIAQVPETNNMKAMAYDFFTPQPIKGTIKQIQT